MLPSFFFVCLVYLPVQDTNGWDSTFFSFFIWNFLLIFFCFYSNNFILSFYDDNDICENVRTRKRYLKYQWEEHLEAGGKKLIELCSGEKRFVLLYFIVIDVAWKFFCFVCNVRRVVVIAHFPRIVFMTRGFQPSPLHRNSSYISSLVKLNLKCVLRRTIFNSPSKSRQ